MGIQNFTAFIKEKFTGWRPANFRKWDHVIIDGNNICYSLYKKNFPWALGGEYDKFKVKITEFFSRAGFKKPIVVFDGAQYEPKKMETIRQRRIEYMTEVRDVQRGPGWATGLSSEREDENLSTERVAPLLMISTFLATLQEMSIEHYIADGEADREIAALANHYKCPVLGSDSDFFIFNLKYGFIYFDRFHEGIVESLYTLEDLQNQFILKEKDMCLLIPAFFGNDFLKIEKKHYDYEAFLKKLSKYINCEDYLTTGDSRIGQENFESIKAFYWDLELPDYYNKEIKNPKSKHMPAELPEWIYAEFKAGNFSVQLVDTYIHKATILPRVVEAIKYDSAWKISRYIRVHLYHMMGISSTAKVKEIVRLTDTARLSDELVSPVALKPRISVRDPLFVDRDKEILSDLVLAVLKCHKLSKHDIESEFNVLPDELKLPIAATIYWYRSLDNPPSKRNLVASLLVSFLMCSDILPRADLPFLPVSYEKKSEHLKALHTFAQWQCVYHDAMSLNYLAREPFHTTNPASLYSGNVAMYYAYASTQKRWLHRLFPHKDSTDWIFLNQLLYLVTGRDEQGRIGKHDIKPQ